jgi:hypothetical protein
MNDRPVVDSTEHSIRREIAIMKRCRHANIASLLEVIDDTQHDKIYLGEFGLFPSGFISVLWLNFLHFTLISHGIPCWRRSAMDGYSTQTDINHTPDAPYFKGRHPRT